MSVHIRSHKILEIRGIGSTVEKVEKIILKYPSEEQVNLCVFDLDGTLTPLNTGYELIEQILLYTSRLRYYIYRIVLRKIFLIVHMLSKIIMVKQDLTRLLLVSAISFTDIDLARRVSRIVCLRSLVESLKSEHRNMLRLARKLENTGKCFTIILSKSFILEKKYSGIPIICADWRIVRGKLFGLKHDIYKEKIITHLVLQGFKPLFISSDSPSELYSVFPIRLLITRTGEKAILMTKDTSSEKIN